MKRLLTLLLLSPLAFAECVGVPSNYHNCQGTVTYPGGNKYIGEYQDGLRNGQGTITYADGRQKIGKWKNDEYQIVMSAADCYEHRYRKVDQLGQIYNALMKQYRSSYTPSHIIENVTNKYLQDVGRADEEYEECKKR
ncbi:hypothetical protein N9598_02830 [Gammaproteobacteria bacterium]|nr:hypothetical protein [Gammaproteobacteria bacterium]